jgi:hypothetical protein
MVVGVGFCKIKVDSNFLLVLEIKCTKFHQDRSKTVDLHTKYTNKQTFSFIYIDYQFLKNFEQRLGLTDSYIVDYIIKSKSESFCAKPRLKTETMSRSATGRSAKRPSRCA